MEIESNRIKDALDFDRPAPEWPTKVRNAIKFFHIRKPVVLLLTSISVIDLRGMTCNKSPGKREIRQLEQKPT